MFQFLIGTLKTTGVPPLIAAIRVFQFLIGTLKTVHEISNDDLRHAVSIPHRYAKNIGRVIGRYGLIKVSIPHRYAKNVYFPHKAHYYIGVSIPHRYAKNPEKDL